MKPLIFMAVVFLLSTHLNAQVKVEATPTGKHAKALNTVKQTREEAKARRQQVKETKKKLKEQKKAYKLYHYKYDSIKELRRDSLGSIEIPKTDSIAISKKILEQADFPVPYKELLLNPISLDSMSINTEGLDSLAMNQSESRAEQLAQDFIPDELNAPDDPLEGLTTPQGQVDQLPVPTRSLKPNPNLVKPEAARKLFAKVDMEQFNQAQLDMKKLKKKYSELPDTRYPEEGTKRNSLEDLPFSKRLYVGGNISLKSTDPLIFDSNIQLGYWINKKWLAGVGFILREQFSSQDSLSTVTGDGYGYSLFTRYDIPKGFFAWAETEFQVNRSVFGSEQNQPRRWQEAYLVGVGREFRIGKVQMMSMILYDFNYKNNDLHTRPLIFRMGVRLSKRP